MAASSTENGKISWGKFFPLSLAAPQIPRTPHKNMESSMQLPSQAENIVENFM